MATVGSIVVELRANSAQFHQEMGKARTGIEQTGKSFGHAQTTLTNFAAKGLGAVIPAAQGVEHSIARVIAGATRMGGVLGALGTAGLIVGGTLAVAAGVQWIQDNIKNWLIFGETVSSTLDRLNEEAEAEKKFLADRRNAISQLATIEAQRAQVRAGIAGANAKLANDPLGEAQASVRGALEAAAAQKRVNDERAFGVQDAIRKNQILAANERLHQEQRIKALRDYDVAVTAVREAQTQKTIKAFVDETSALMDQLQTRLQTREQIEARAAAAAQRTPGAGVFGGFAAIRDLIKDQKDLALGFAAWLDAGVPLETLLGSILATEEGLKARAVELLDIYREFPGVLAPFKELIQNIAIGGFQTAIDAGRNQLVALGLTMNALDTSVMVLAKRLGDDLPAGINRADPATVRLIQRFQLLKAAADAAGTSVANLEASL